jgi:uncharacterized membrane protein
MRLSDRSALAFILAMIVGGFVNIPIIRAPVALSVNVGGALIPAGLAVYLILTSDDSSEKLRSVIATVVTAAAVYAALKFLNPEEQTMLVDPLYVFAALAALVGYLSGRSRRSAFIGATLGMVVVDAAHYAEIRMKAIPGATRIGGAGAFDAVVIAGILAVLIAELVGETLERLGGGPKREYAGEPKDSLVESGHYAGMMGGITPNWFDENGGDYQ